MALVNQAKREINAKIVFFGPGLSGKSTNLKHVFNKLKPEFRGAIKAMTVQAARMLFFDFTPPGDGNVHGFRVRFHVYTVSGPVVDPAAWKMVLKGVDGIVFVADSAADRQEDNRASLDNLTSYLKGYGQSLASIPVVIQFNKCDLSDALETSELERTLNPSRLPSFKASSQSGEGVLQTTLGLVKTVLAALRDKGLEGIAGGDSLQRIVEAPAASAQAAVAAQPELRQPAQEAAPELQGAEMVAAQARTRETELPKAQAPQAPSAQAQTAQAPSAQAPAVEEPLSLEVSGAPEAAGPGLFRLPLTIRSGARTKSVVLTLALSLEEG
jgi:signal recognition particle receptor subunit beta